MTQIICPQLVGKRIQKIEKNEGEGTIILHTKDFSVEFKAVFNRISEDREVVHLMSPRDTRPEPLVIPANK